MKNIHLIPTSQPSRLHKIGNELGLTNTPNSNFLAKQHNIYITSDEKIKLGDWFYADEFAKPEQAKIFEGNLVNGFIKSACKKVILTTDQSLDGVQAIDDEFLEWFVKNPSCEGVEVELQMLCKYCGQEGCDRCKGYEDIAWYKIIISQEEPKQETIEETAARLFTKERCPTSFETLQKAFISNANFNTAKSERMYSEEEVYSILEQSIKDCHSWELEEHYSGDYKNLKEWFEQFKNKNK